MQNYRVNGNPGMRRRNCGCSNGNGYMANNQPMDCCNPSGKIQVYKEHSGCCDREDMLEGMPIAMAYVPWQCWKNIYEPQKGFHRGTIFEELDLPFKGKGGCNS